MPRSDRISRMEPLAAYGSHERLFLQMFVRSSSMTGLRVLDSFIRRSMVEWYELHCTIRHNGVRSNFAQLVFKNLCYIDKDVPHFMYRQRVWTKMLWQYFFLSRLTYSFVRNRIYYLGLRSQCIF